MEQLASPSVFGGHHQQVPAVFHHHTASATPKLSWRLSCDCKPTISTPFRHRFPHHLVVVTTRLHLAARPRILYCPACPCVVLSLRRCGYSRGHGRWQRSRHQGPTRVLQVRIPRRGVCRRPWLTRQMPGFKPTARRSLRRQHHAHDCHDCHDCHECRPVGSDHQRQPYHVTDCVL